LRNRPFLELRQGLRDELGRSTDPAVGPDDIPRLNWALNRAYEKLWKATNWKHLESTFTPFVANAGQQFFSLPAGCDSTRILEVRNFWGSSNTPVPRGIGFREYAIWDSYAAARGGNPVSRYDIKWVNGIEMMELWPISNDNGQRIYVQGIVSITPLVADTDICLLDDKLVVLQAACRFITNQLVLQEMKLELSELYTDEIANAASDRRTVAINGELPSQVPNRVVLRVQGA
jgi:hypothetical protein